MVHWWIDIGGVKLKNLPCYQFVHNKYHMSCPIIKLPLSGDTGDCHPNHGITMHSFQETPFEMQENPIQ